MRGMPLPWTLNMSSVWPVKGMSIFSWLMLSNPLTRLIAVFRTLL